MGMLEKSHRMFWYIFTGQGHLEPGTMVLEETIISSSTLFHFSITFH